jgi:probable phosphoglycerate mutase
MRRAAQTAQPLALAHGLPTAVRADLREVDLGDWEGGVFARVAAAGDPLYREFARVGRFELVPNAESDEHLRERVSAALSEITLAHPGETVAVVVHLGVINAVLAELVEGPRTITIMLEHTSVTVVRAFADGSRDLVVANDCHHLYDPVLVRPASVPT